jgi:hypothetical protein
MSGPSAAYEERLWAPWTWWFVTLVLVASLAFAVGVPLGALAGVVTGVVSGAVAAALLLRWAARLRVYDGVLAAGRARLPVSVVRTCLPLAADAAAALRGRDADPRAYLLVRPWLPLAVRVDLQDPDDPTPYWYVGTRDPGRLAAAVLAERSDRDAARPDTAGWDG